MNIPLDVKNLIQQYYDELTFYFKYCQVFDELFLIHQIQRNMSEIPEFFHRYHIQILE